MYTEIAEELEVDARLGVLPFHADIFSGEISYRELVDFLRSHPEKPGALIVAGTTVVAAVSHRLYLDPACSAPGDEPAAHWLQRWNTLRPLLLLPLKMSIATAYAHTQRRPVQALYEPIAVRTGSGVGLIESRDLLLAHAQLVGRQAGLPGKKPSRRCISARVKLSDCCVQPPGQARSYGSPFDQASRGEAGSPCTPAPGQLKKLEQELAELQERYQIKDAFLSTVSHELRAPVANMRLAIQLLRLNVNPKKREHYLQILELECLRERELIDDLLDIQQLERGTLSASPEQITIDTWLPPLLAPFQSRAELREQSFTCECSPSLPILSVDRRCLERILVELLNNACKYTPPGGTIAVCCRSGLDSSGGPTVELTVRNSGNEIPLAQLPHIFDKFYRVPNQDLWQQGGSGLGLSLVKEMVEQMGGTIRVESHSGETSFLVSLP